MRKEEPLGVSGDPAAEAPDLGPVLLEQKPKPLAADLCLILAALFLIPTVLMPFTADFRTGVVAGPVCAGLGVLSAFFGILYICNNAGKAAYLHERGLRVREGRGWRVVRYQDVTEMTFQATRMFTNGAYTGTSQVIGLKTEETGNKPIAFRHVYREKAGLVTGYRDATPMNQVCDVLTNLIARRMAELLRRGESVEWTRAMRISNRGVEIVGRAGEDVEWDRIARVDVERGIFRLWVEGTEKPRVQTQVGEPNFFPGYVLVVQRLRGQSGASAVPAATVQAAPAPAPAISEGTGSIRVQFAPTVEDNAALTRWHYRATPAGRKAWAGRVWGLPVAVLLIGLLIGVINLVNKDMAELSAIAAAILIGGLLLRVLLGWLIPVMDRMRLARELRAAQELARQGRGADPFGPREVLLGPEGYAIRAPQWQGRHGWTEVSRVEWSDGYVFVFLAADRVRRETIELILPPRAFHGLHEAEDAYQRMLAWQETAERGNDRG